MFDPVVGPAIHQMGGRKDWRAPNCKNNSTRFPPSLSLFLMMFGPIVGPAIHQMGEPKDWRAPNCKNNSTRFPPSLYPYFNDISIIFMIFFKGPSAPFQKFSALRAPFTFLLTNFFLHIFQTPRQHLEARTNIRINFSSGAFPTMRRI